MEVMGSYVIDILMTLASTTILALIGFVWKISHRVSSLEKTIESLKVIHDRDVNEIRRDIEIICSNVDKNRDWTTNRMMSIARDYPKG
tara:strand:- start:115 stop:378 length:264 start_codon:yes stop_codon:yes gene_type:complete